MSVMVERALLCGLIQMIGVSNGGEGVAVWVDTDDWCQ